MLRNAAAAVEFHNSGGEWKDLCVCVIIQGISSQLLGLATSNSKHAETSIASLIGLVS